MRAVRPRGDVATWEEPRRIGTFTPTRRHVLAKSRVDGKRGGDPLRAPAEQRALPSGVLHGDDGGGGPSGGAGAPSGGSTSSSSCSIRPTDATLSFSSLKRTSRTPCVARPSVEMSLTGVRTTWP